MSENTIELPQCRCGSRKYYVIERTRWVVEQGTTPALEGEANDTDVHCFKCHAYYPADTEHAKTVIAYFANVSANAANNILKASCASTDDA